MKIRKVAFKNFKTARGRPLGPGKINQLQELIKAGTIGKMVDNSENVFCPYCKWAAPVKKYQLDGWEWDESIVHFMEHNFRLFDEENGREFAAFVSAAVEKYSDEEDEDDDDVIESLEIELVDKDEYDERGLLKQIANSLEESNRVRNKLLEQITEEMRLKNEILARLLEKKATRKKTKAANS